MTKSHDRSVRDAEPSSGAVACPCAADRRVVVLLDDSDTWISELDHDRRAIRTLDALLAFLRGHGPRLEGGSINVSSRDAGCDERP